jgi:hypothetical protein
VETLRAINVTDGGGGGGGGGGFAALICNRLINAGTFTAAGGAGGALHGIGLVGVAGSWGTAYRASWSCASRGGGAALVCHAVKATHSGRLRVGALLHRPLAGAGEQKGEGE